MNTEATLAPDEALAPVGPDEAAARASFWLDRERTDVARAELELALRSHPRHTGLLYESARADYIDDDYVRGKETIGQLLAIDPGHASGRLLMFLIEEQLGEFAQAESLILELIRESPESAGYLCAYARLMLRTLHFEKAGALCNEALRLSPNLDAAMRTRVLCELATGQSTRDSGSMARLIVSDPDDWHTLTLVVYSLAQAGRTREALRLARDLLRQRPGDRHLLEFVKSLSRDTHWTLVPMWPMQRWGWPAAFALWGGGILVSKILAQSAPAYHGAFVALWLSYAAYTWIWPPLLKRWLARGD